MDVLDCWLRMLGGPRANAACTPAGEGLVEDGVRRFVVEGEASSTLWP